MMKEDKLIDSFTRKLMSIITKAATCGLMFDEYTKVQKVLNAVPDKFLPVVAIIEMIVDFKTVKLEEIIKKLKTYEERIKFRKESQEDNRRWNGDKSQIDCYKCGKLRHYAHEWANKKNEEIAALLVETDDEPALLMCLIDEN
uniref:Zinc finger, CCHC-type n=1 Tax=Tanacetum cinerariifolium TaxID=118510 RepID=A0A6L2JGM7_TANCI|nr:hypothetical protein [Tanacetum cinerariifolium]